MEMSQIIHFYLSNFTTSRRYFEKLAKKNHFLAKRFSDRLQKLFLLKMLELHEIMLE